ncbi:MAG: HesB/IscA family protein [Dongiaceae bacterium]
MNPRPPVLTITDRAAEQVRYLMSQRSTPAKGLRIGVRARGCSGMAYTLEYTDQEHPGDEVIQHGDLTIYIDPKATMFLLGTQMDYVEDKLQSGFTFKNPNEKGRCGCGESFHV